MSHLSQDKTKLLTRVRRLKGQIEAIERAIEAEQPCGAVLQLVASVRGATTGLTMALIEDQLRHHILDEQNETQRQQDGEDLIAVLRTYLK